MELSNTPEIYQTLSKTYLALKASDKLGSNLVPETFNEFYRFKSSIHEHHTRRCENLVLDIENSVKSVFFFFF